MAPRLSRGKVSYAGMDTPDSDDESENGDDAPVARPKQKKTSKRVVADSDDEFDIASSNDEEEEVDDDVEVEEEDASAEEDAEMATSDAEATSPDAAEGSEAESTIGANDPEPEVVRSVSFVASSRARAAVADSWYSPTAEAQAKGQESLCRQGQGQVRWSEGEHPSHRREPPAHL